MEKLQKKRRQKRWLICVASSSEGLCIGGEVVGSWVIWGGVSEEVEVTLGSLWNVARTWAKELTHKLQQHWAENPNGKLSWALRQCIPNSCQRVGNWREIGRGVGSHAHQCTESKRIVIKTYWIYSMNNTSNVWWLSHICFTTSFIFQMTQDLFIFNLKCFPCSKSFMLVPFWNWQHIKPNWVQVPKKQS